jgi:uncharacterized protein (TIGR02118 family)
MFKVYGYWTAPRPEDVEAFEEHYMNTHIVNASKVPHLRDLKEYRMDEAYGGGEPAHYRIAELTFDSREDFEKSSESPEWAVMGEDAGVLRERFDVVNTGDLSHGDDFPIA